MRKNVKQAHVEITIGERILDALIEHHMSQIELAEQLQVSPSTISQWCNDKRHPKPRHQKQLCKVLGLDIYELQGYEAPQNDFTMTTAELRLITCFRQMNETQRHFLLLLLETFLQS